MKWVLWPNAPIIGGWAVLFTPRKYIFIFTVNFIVNDIKTTSLGDVFMVAIFGSFISFFSDKIRTDIDNFVLIHLYFSSFGYC